MVPAMERKGEISRLLAAHREGDRMAFDRLIPLVYDDLRRIAHNRLVGHRRGHLDTTGVVHEAYLKLAGQAEGSWESRAHFFAVAARAMRHVVVDFARRRRAGKRGGAPAHVSLDETTIAVGAEADRLLLLDESLHELSALGERMTRVVECRFFAGLTEEETAEALGVSLRTVQREWAKARAWLTSRVGP